MKCEKCGSEIKQLIISVSDAYGSDCSISVDITECEKNAVVFETDKSWTGYEQDGEDANQDIRCPICGKNPFQNDEKRNGSRLDQLYKSKHGSYHGGHFK